MGRIKQSPIGALINEVLENNPELKKEVLLFVIRNVGRLFGKRKRKKIQELQAEVKMLREQQEGLAKDSAWLRCLNETGLDNWEGYDIAIDRWDEKYEETYGEL